MISVLITGITIAMFGEPCPCDIPNGLAYAQAYEILHAKARAFNKPPMSREWRNTLVRSALLMADAMENRDFDAKQIEGLYKMYGSSVKPVSVRTPEDALAAKHRFDGMVNQIRAYAFEVEHPHRWVGAPVQIPRNGPICTAPPLPGRVPKLVIDRKRPEAMCTGSPAIPGRSK